MSKYLKNKGKKDLDEEQAAAEIDKLKKNGPIMELLEPSAREYTNVPQTGSL